MTLDVVAALIYLTGESVTLASLSKLGDVEFAAFDSVGLAVIGLSALVEAADPAGGRTAADGYSVGSVAFAAFSAAVDSATAFGAAAAAAGLAQGGAPLVSRD